MLLQGKTLFITGAAGALGRAVAERAAAFGAAKLILADIVAVDDAALAAARNAAPADISLQVECLDLGDLPALQQAVASLPDIDALCNIAGGFAMGSKAHEESDEGWQAMFAINVQTMQNSCKAWIPRLIAQGSGCIVNVGALGALQGQALMSSYIASKSTVMRLTESMSAELKNAGINVNAVLPNVIDTPRNRTDMPDADYTQWVNPHDLGNVVCMLASDYSKAVHGALVPVAGLG